MNLALKLHHLVFPIAAAVFASQAIAFGPQGHRMVGYIADGDLTPAAKTAVQQIMGKDSLSSVATWMDDVRDDPTWGPKMKEWHFDDVPVCSAAPAPCANGNCAHAQIAAALDTLRNAQDPDQKLFGLRVLVHLVGDIHQPLHSSDNADHGGNLVTLTNRMQCEDYKTGASKACNLHQYWDGVLIRRELRKTTETALAPQLSSKYALPDNDTKSPADWIAQSNELGKTVTYGKLTGFAYGRPGAFSTKATREYDQDAQEAINRQLALAGHRLAVLLNDIYK